jgi:putative nucleotidyltransferase with HDIG domain
MLPLAERPYCKRPTLDQLIQQIEDISTLPHIAMRIVEVINDANTAASDIKQLMEGDPALSARVLRCVNSSAYGLRAKITNLQQAICYLGLKQIRNLAVTVSVGNMFKKEVTIGPYRRSNLWKHLVAVGICARLIAMRLGLPNFEDCFLAGLLHDIGIILEDQHLHKYFCQLIQTLDLKKNLAENEHPIFGFDHTQLGAKIATRWNFPGGILDAIQYHHISGHYRGDDINIVRCVDAANIICNLKTISSLGVTLGKVSPAALNGLGLGKSDLVVLSQDMDRELENNASLIQIGAGDNE